MTNKEILIKSLEKARKNGYTYYEKLLSDLKDKNNDNYFVDNTIIYSRIDNNISLNQIFFSHEFCKAFFGTRNFTVVKPKNDPDSHPREKDIYEYDKPAWQYHLQQMVLEEEPLKYIERYL